MWRTLVLVFLAVFVGCGAPSKPAPAAVDVATPRPEPGATEAAETTGDAWRIGAVLSLTGSMAQFGLDTRDGIDLAVEQINARGGAGGRPLKVLYRDDEGHPVTMKDAVRASIGDDHALAVLGEIASSLTVAGGAVASELQTPMLSPGSTGVQVTKVGEFVFAAIPSDDRQGAAAARWAIRDRKKRRVAILSTTGDAYSTLVAGAFRAAVPEHGGTIVADVTLEIDGRGLDAALATLQAARPDVIFAPVHYNVMADVAPRAKSLGLAGSLFLGTDGWDSEELWRSDSADALEGAQFVTHWIHDVPSPASRAFVEAFRARSGRAPSSLSAIGFEATLLLADAIRRSGTPLRRSVRDALAAPSRFEGLLGPETMEAGRRPNRPFVVAVLQERTAKWAASVGFSH